MTLNIASAFLLLTVFILLYSVIIQVFTILFRLTGLTQEKARMQVISMLTNSGFTTSESELIVSSRKRRRLAQLTMLFGYSFTVIIVSSIVNLFMRLSTAQLRDLLPVALYGVIMAIVAFCLFRLRPVGARLDRLIEKAGNRIMFGQHSNPVMLIDIYGTNAMAEIFLEHLPMQIRDKTLAESGLREKLGIHVLYIKRAGTGTPDVTADTILQEGDRLLVFGNYSSIRHILEHPNHPASERNI